jgi:hypothetical protein
MRSPGLDGCPCGIGEENGGVVIIDYASFAHGPVLMRFNATLAWTEEKR